MTGPKSIIKSVAGGVGGGYAVCRVDISRGRRIRRQSGVDRSGFEGGGNEPDQHRRSIYALGHVPQQCDKLHASYAPCARKGSGADRKTMAPLGGRSGARNRGILWLPRGGNRAAGQGRKTPAVWSGRWCARNARARAMVLQISHALDAWLISV